MTPDELRRALRLVVITDEELAGPRGVAWIVGQALAKGAPSIQLRMKKAMAGEVLAAAQRLAPVVREAGALFWVNDRLDVALACGADGVHLGPDDLPVAAARRAAPPGFLIGYSADDPEAARAAAADGADYIGCGTVCATESKRAAGEAVGLAGLERVVRSTPLPVVGIGGITPGRAAGVADTGAAGVAVLGAVMGAADPGAASAALLRPFSPRS